MKAERLVWQDSTCFTLNSQCWNNDGISQGNTRGSKGFFVTLKENGSTGSCHQFPLQGWVAVSAIYLRPVFVGFMILLPLMALSSQLWPVAGGTGWCPRGKQSLLCSEPAQQYGLSSAMWELLCVMTKWLHCWPRFLVSASPPGVPQSLSAVCVTLTLTFLLLVLLFVPEVTAWSPGMKRCRGARGVSHSMKVEHVQRGLKWFRRLRSGEAGGNMKAMYSKRDGEIIAATQ